MKSTFTISDASPDTLEITWKWWGSEEYRLNGTLIAKFWDLSFSGERRLEVSGHVVRIAYAMRGKDYLARAFVDDQLRVEELLPEIRAKAKKSLSLKSFLTTVAIWTVVGAVSTFAYLSITRGCCL